MYLELSDNGISLVDICKSVNGKLVSSSPELIVYGVSTDTRTIKSCDIFFAIKGENSDGHIYIQNAIEKGAAAIVSEKELDISIPYIIVNDTIEALGLLAREYKRTIKPITIGITGSVGKTSTKEFVYSVLDQKFETKKTEGNFNNQIGLPLTIFGLNVTHKAAVLEMGMDGRGQISYLSKIAEPDISIITNIGTSHIGLLGSREEIRNAKIEILDGMKEDGIIILNGDEPLLQNIDTGKICKQYVGINNDKCDFNAINIRKGDNEITFDISIKEYDEVIRDVIIKTAGTHHVYNALCAFACGLLLGMKESQIKEGLLEFKQVKLRTQIIEKDNYKIIADCYNSSPESVKAAIEILNDEASKTNAKRVAVLGEMRELGDKAVELHKSVGEFISDKIDLLFTVGEMARNIALKASENKDLKVISLDGDNYEEVSSEIMSKIDNNSIVLFKASRALKFETIVDLMK